MFVLAINTATNKTSVALAEGGKTVAQAEWPSLRDEAEKLLPNIRKILLKFKIKPAELDSIAVVTGPGPFTGLRVGVATANALAFGLKIPLFAFDVFSMEYCRISPALVNKTAIVIGAGGQNYAVKTLTMKIPLILDTEKLASWFGKNKKIVSIIANLNQQDTIRLGGILKVAKLSVKIMPENKLKSFGDAMTCLLKRKNRNSWCAKPVYLQKPHITKSKKQVFAASLAGK